MVTTGICGGHSGVSWGPPVIEKDSPEPKGDGRDKRNVPTKRRLHACSLLGMLEAVVISATVVASASASVIPVVAPSATEKEKDDDPHATVVIIASAVVEER